MQISRWAGAAVAVTALAAAVGAPATASAAKKPAPTTEVTSCGVVVKATGQYADAHSGTVTFYNQGKAPVIWTLTWDVENTADLWNGRDEDVTWSQEGTTLTVTGQSWNRTVQPGKSLTLGYVAGGHTAPAGVKMNGVACGDPSPANERARSKAEKQQARAAERQAKAEARVAIKAMKAAEKAEAKAAKDAQKAAEKATNA
ncbi:cellulose binding domain-containing protein [Motilibacter aurantiacus]|uniref:cellulose binding domain-containing protein n=1 Tax=Motilibacter aurantiacus TaxID=2714955 RepID=UPI00140BFE15|nr:cellulose binding domain-containing protein [Motilibacter aurantiacus]NHC45553.1 hypothetical protein [Motilibacter aurantiacus]